MVIDDIDHHDKLTLDPIGGGTIDILTADYISATIIDVMIINYTSHLYTKL